MLLNSMRRLENPLWRCRRVTLREKAYPKLQLWDRKSFKDGLESVEDKLDAERLSTIRNENIVQFVREVLNSNLRLSVQKISDNVVNNKMTAHTIITEDLLTRKSVPTSS